MPEPQRLDELAEHVRAKNAGPFWLTLDVFFGDTASFERVVEAEAITPQVVARLYRVDASTVRLFVVPSLRVIKVSFPRPQVQGGLRDRDMHAGQQHVPLAQLTIA